MELKAETLLDLALTALDFGFFMGVEIGIAFKELDIKLEGITNEYKALIAKVIEDEKICLREVK